MEKIGVSCCPRGLESECEAHLLACPLLISHCSELTHLRPCRERNKMDTALYERGRQLLEAKLAEHRATGRLEELGSREEANLVEIARREGAGYGGERGKRPGGQGKQHHVKARQDGEQSQNKQVWYH